MLSVVERQHLLKLNNISSAVGVRVFFCFFFCFSFFLSVQTTRVYNNSNKLEIIIFTKGILYTLSLFFNYLLEL